MKATKIYAACSWGVIAVFTLYAGMIYGSSAAWWFFVALVPSLIVFVWWIVDSNALERRIKRLEVRSEIADERRVVTQTDLKGVEHKLNAIETRVADVEEMESQSMKPGADFQEGLWQARVSKRREKEFSASTSIR
jgi:hypothetical protein